MVGFFANPVVIRASLTGHPSFGAVVDRAAGTIAGAIEHGDYPFELLMQRLGFGRHLGFNPNPEVMFVLQLPHRFAEERRAVEHLAADGAFAAGPTGVRLDLGGLVVEKYNPTQIVTLNDLALEMVEIGGELSAALHYRTNLFEAGTVRRLGQAIRHLLAQLPAAMETDVAALDLPGLPVRAPVLSVADTSGIGRRPGSAPAGQSAGRDAALAARAATAADSAPRTPEEAEIRRLFVETLGTDAIGRDDSFFTRGGHSLLALQLLARIRDTFQVELPLRRLFEVSTIAGLAAVVAGRDGAVPDRPILPRATAGPAPLSFAQERLWFQDRLERAPYVIPLAARIEGNLDVRILEAALAKVVARHDILRTVIVERDGAPVQEVLPAAAASIPVVALPEAQTDGGELDLDAAVRHEIARPFDLSAGPLWRVSLLAAASRPVVIVLVMHHAVSDGWSVGVLLRELSAAYAGFAAGRPVSFAPLPIQFADHACWQREQLESGRLDHEVVYWRRQLDGIGPLRLPVDRPRPPLQSFRGATERFEIGPRLTAALRRLSEAEGVTLFMTLLAVFQVLLHRYSGQDDVAVATPVAGRTRSETEGLIGCFLNVLVMRGDLSGGPTFADHLRRTRECCLDAYAHQSVPFEEVVKALDPARDLSRQPLAQVMFVLQNAPLPPLRLGDDVTLVPLSVDRGLTTYDLTLFFTETGTSLAGAIEFARDLFEPGTIRRMIGHLETLLDAVVENPAAPAAHLRLLPAQEQDWLTAGCNQPDGPAAGEDWTARFETHAAERPAGIAIECGAERVSYRDLEARVARLTRRLVAAGAAPEQIVAVSTGHTTALAISFLAVARSGAAWVYIDPALPAQRRRFVLEAARARIVVRDRTAAQVDWRGLVALEVDCDAPDAPEDGTPDAPPGRPEAVDPDSLAYVIFTSGSTGQPKGVLVTRRGLSTYLGWAAAAYGLTPGDRTLSYTSPAYDFSITALLGPLVSGGTVVMAANAGAVDGRPLLDALEHLALLKVTPGGARLMAALGGTAPRDEHRNSAGTKGEGADPAEHPSSPIPYLWGGHPEAVRSEGPEGRPAAARTIVAGGEALRGEDVAHWLRCDPPPAVFNEYGPTEAVVGCAIHRVEPGSGPGPVPIGRPAAGARLYVVDRTLELLPAGVPGELCVGGEALARGYLGQPDLTAERFVPDPYSGVPGARMYRTGDLVRRRTDGVLEYLGRMDDQVKVRGCLVEPAEVETALAVHPAVAASAVVADDGDGQTRLRAFVVPKGRRRVRPETLLEWLRARLPQYMVPSSVAVVGALPMTPAGKVDRQALSALAAKRRPARPGRRDGMDADERLVAAAWSDLLRLDVTRPDAEFFALGGSSLLVVQLAARLRRSFGVEPPLVSLFETTSVAAQAALMKRLREAGPGEPDRRGAETPAGAVARPLLVPLATSRRGRPIVCVHPSGGGVSAYAPLARALRPARPVYGLESRAAAGVAEEHATLLSLAGEYAATIEQRWPGRRHRLVGWSTAGILACHVAAAIERLGGDVAIVVLLDTTLPGEARPAKAVGLDAVLDRAARLVETSRLDERDVTRLAGSLLSLAEHHERLARSLSLPPLSAKVVRLVAAATAGSDSPSRFLRAAPPFTPFAIEQFLVAGDHFSILAEPAVSGLAERLSAVLGTRRAGTDGQPS